MRERAESSGSFLRKAESRYQLALVGYLRRLLHWGPAVVRRYLVFGSPGGNGLLARGVGRGRGADNL